MKANLRILHLEDNPTDAELIIAMLEQEDFVLQVKRVATQAEFQQALEAELFDLIISDFTLPSYNGMIALTVARQICPDLPFIFFSGTIGEEAAVESLKNGATDYVLKHRPEKLISAVQRALREIEDRRMRQAAEKTLQEREKWFRALTENALDVVSVLDHAGRFKYTSPSAERILGYQPRDLAGRDAFGMIHSEDGGVAKQAFQEAIERPDQRIILEFRFRHADGSWRDLEAIGQSLLHDPDVAGIVVNSRDVTEKKRVEAQFLRTQRMECIGVLAGGIAHDLNNILAPVVMASEMLRQHVADDEGRKMLEIVKTSGERGSEMVRQILSFARGAVGEPIALQLHRLIDDVSTLARETFPRSIEVRTKIDLELRLIKGHATQLHQVLMNLCVNARDAMPKGGVLGIEAGNIHLDESSGVNDSALGSGPFVRLAVSDTGIGIPAHLREKIFEPFFTTKAEGKGTGLGLPTVKSIVKNHGGFLDFISEEGKGTTFQIYLPATTTGDTLVTERSPTPFPAGHGELILLVDDETAILEMTKLTLESYNYRIVTARNGVEALDAYQLQHAEITLVITDLMMPIMDGIALIRALRAINPNLLVVCSSGAGSAAKRAETKGLNVQAFLSKPYIPERLLGTLAAVIGGRPIGSL